MIKNIIPVVLLLFSFNSFALKCEITLITRDIKTVDYIYVGIPIDNKSNNTGVFQDANTKFFKDTMTPLKILKGEPDSYEINTLFHTKEFSEFYFSNFSQIKKDQKYIVFGNYNKIPFYGPCGYKVHEYNKNLIKLIDKHLKKK